MLVIPKDHYPDLAALAAADGTLLTELVNQVDEVARAEGISGRGYRVVFNTGTDAARLYRTSMRMSSAGAGWAGPRAEALRAPG